MVARVLGGTRVGEYRCPLSGLLWRGVNGDTWEPGRPQKQGMLPNIGSWCVTCVGHRSGTETSHVTVRLASHMRLGGTRIPQTCCVLRLQAIIGT